MFFFFFIFLTINIFLMFSKEIYFFEEIDSSSHGFANQVFIFNRKIFHIKNSGLEGSRFFVFGPYSSHIGKYRGNCSLSSFFSLNDPKWIQKNYISNRHNLEYLKSYNFIKKLNFIKNEKFSIDFNINTSRKFIPFKHELNLFFNNSPKNLSHQNYFYKYLANLNKTETVSFPSFFDDRNEIEFHFFEFFQFDNKLVEIAKSIVLKEFNSQDFVALHARLGDFKGFCKSLPKFCFLEKQKYTNFINTLNNKGLKVFVISNEFFPSNSNIIYLSNEYLKNALFNTNNDVPLCFLNNMKYVKLFVEMIICCNSKEFYYNEFSSMSLLIISLCKYIGSKPRFSKIRSYLINS